MDQPDGNQLPSGAPKCHCISDGFTPRHSDHRPRNDGTRLYLDNPEGREGDKKIDLGVNLVTRKTKPGLRHFVKSVVENPLASRIKLKNRDEIMVVDGVISFNLQHEEVVEMMLKLQVNTAIDLVVRRKTSPIHTDSEGDEEFCYEDIDAKVIFNEKDGTINTLSKESKVSEGELHFLLQGVTQHLLRLSDADLYLRVVNDRLVWAPHDPDPSYKMDFVRYTALVYDQMAPTQKGIAVMVRCRSGTPPTPAYVMPAKGDDVTLKELCRDTPDGPGEIDKNCAFWLKPIDTKTAFKRLSETDVYLAVNRDRTSVTLKHPEDADALKLDDHFQFVVCDAN